MSNTHGKRDQDLGGELGQHMVLSMVNIQLHGLERPWVGRTLPDTSRNHIRRNIKAQIRHAGGNVDRQ